MTGEEPNPADVEVRWVEQSLRELHVRASRLDYKVCDEHKAAGHELINSEASHRREQAATYEAGATAPRAGRPDDDVRPRIAL